MADHTNSSADTRSASGSAWNERMSETSSRVEQEVRRVVRYLDEEVVPEVRRNSSSALRTAAAELQRMARALDEHHRPHGPGPHGRP